MPETSQILGYCRCNFTFAGSCDFVLNKIYSTNLSEEEERYFSKMLAVGQSGYNQEYVVYFFLAYYYIVCKSKDIEKIIDFNEAHNRQTQFTAAAV